MRRNRFKLGADVADRLPAALRGFFQTAADEIEQAGIQMRRERVETGFARED